MVFGQVKKMQAIRKVPALLPPYKAGLVVKLACQYEPEIQRVRISTAVLMGDDDKIILDWNRAIF